MVGMVKYADMIRKRPRRVARTVRISFVVAREIRGALQEHLARNGVRVSDVVNLALAEHLDRQRKNTPPPKEAGNE